MFPYESRQKLKMATILIQSVVDLCSSDAEGNVDTAQDRVRGRLAIEEGLAFKVAL